MTLEEKIDSIKKEMAAYSEVDSTYSYLLDRGQNIKKDPNLMQEKYKVDGCISSVWLCLNVQSSNLHIKGYSDSLIVRGIIDILIQLYHKENTQIVYSTITKTLMEELKLPNLFSIQRTNGLFAMVSKIRYTASPEAIS